MVESGIFYSTFIDPILTSMRKRVASEINAGQTVVDVACGTGEQVFALAEIAKRAVGIDLSISMIEKARQTKNKNKVGNVDFHVCDATNLSIFAENEFDVATMSLALHQFEPKLLLSVLNEIKRVAGRIIIVDYAIPLPKNYVGFGSKVAEFMAGTEHNRNFKSYYSQGGLNEILKNHGFNIEKSIYFGKGAFQLVVCF